MALILFPVHTDADNSQPLKCAIQLSEGFLPGQNYDLLKAFGLSQRDSTEIFLAEPQARYLDSLRLDSLDILVLPASEYKDTSGVTAMILGDTSVVWVIKADQKRSKELVKWFVTYRGSAEYSNLLRRFSKCYGAPGSQWEARSGIISPYDDLLKANAKSIGGREYLRRSKVPGLPAKDAFGLHRRPGSPEDVDDSRLQLRGRKGLARSRGQGTQLRHGSLCQGRAVPLRCV